MSPELTDQIIEQCPILFRALGYIEAPDGWFELIRATSKNLEMIARDQKMKGEDPIYAAQIKSKFGSLRFYCDGLVYPSKATTIIEFAEKLSVKICEECGEKGTTKSHGWIWTLCDLHHIEIQDKIKRRNQ